MLGHNEWRMSALVALLQFMPVVMYAMQGNFILSAVWIIPTVAWGAVAYMRWAD